MSGAGGRQVWLFALAQNRRGEGLFVTNMTKTMDHAPTEDDILRIQRNQSYEGCTVRVIAVTRLGVSGGGEEDTGV